MKVALIGSGEIAPDNAAAIQDSSKCTLGPVMDLNEEAARSLAVRHGVSHTTSIDEVLESSSVDAVVIAVPHHLHASVAIQAAGAGKHVIVEKPIASNLADADAMIEACERAGVSLTVLFSYRYEPRVVRARNLIQEGAIGDLVGTGLQFMTEKPAAYWAQGYKGRVQTDWRGSWDKAGGGVLLMNTCHMLDYFRHITGLEVARVYAEMGTLNSPVEVEDMISVTLRYVGGEIGSVQAASLARGEKWRSDERIWGTHGTIQLAPEPSVYTMRRVGGLKTARWQKMRDLPRSTRLATFFDRFAGTIEAGSPPDVTGLDGRVNLALVLSAYRAASTGAPVDIGGPSAPVTEETGS